MKPNRSLDKAYSSVRNTSDNVCLLPNYQAQARRLYFHENKIAHNNLTKAPKGKEISESHHKLNGLIDTLEQNLSNIVIAREKDFLSAYNAQMSLIKRELKDLREQSSKEKIQAKHDMKLRMLEKERDWFKAEALKLDKVSSQYKEAFDKLKATMSVAEEDRDFYQTQLFNAKKYNKALNIDIQRITNTTVDPSHVMKSLDTQNESITLSHSQTINPNSKANIEVQIHKIKEENTRLLKREAVYKETIKNLKKSSKNNNKKGPMTERNNVYNSELRDIFKSCIEVAKKDIRNRRKAVSEYSSARSLKLSNAAASNLASNKIGLSQFTHTDKKKVMELFLSEESTLLTLYQNIVPDQFTSSTSFSTVNFINALKCLQSKSADKNDSKLIGSSFERMPTTAGKEMPSSDSKGWFKMNI